MADKNYYATVKVTLSSLNAADTAYLYGSITANYDPAYLPTQLFLAQKDAATVVKVGDEIPLNPSGLTVPSGKVLTLLFDLNNTMSSLPTNTILNGSQAFTPPSDGAYDLTGTGGTITGTVTWTPI